MILIGDIHGKFYRYFDLIRDTESSFQVGDFGLGFDSWTDAKTKGVMKKANDVGNHRFIRGNHDDPRVCRDTVGYVRSGTYFEEESLYAVGGAWSIDSMHRTAGVNWWEDEELTIDEFEVILDHYTKSKPSIMITHDCPTDVANKMFFESGLMQRKFGLPLDVEPIRYVTRTGEYLQKMFEAHQPDKWIFGHWHIDVSEVIEGTEFTCLGELKTKEI